MRAYRLLAPVLLLVFICAALTPARSGMFSTFTWIGGSGGASNDSSKWSPTALPHAADATLFGPASGYNVAWNAPTDTVASITVQAGEPRFNCIATVGVGGMVLVKSESLSVLSGTLRCDHLLVGSGGFGTLLVSGQTAFVSTRGTGGSFFGDGGTGRVTVNGGAALTSNGFIDMGFGASDACTTSVAGRSPFTFLNSSINTANAATGDMIVGDQGHAVLNLFNSGHGEVAGAILIGKNAGGIGDVEMFQSGIGTPTLHVHGITNVGWNQSGVVPGTGTLNVARGSATLDGHCNIACGTAFATGGFLHAGDGITMFYPSPAGPQAPALTVASGSAQVDSSFVIGDGTARPAHGANAVPVLVTGSGSLSYTGSRTLLVGNDGLLAATNGGSITSSAEIDVSGMLEVSNASVHAPLVHAVQNTYSAQVQTWGTLAARILLDPTTALVGVGGTSTVGDSTATDGFVSSGTVRVVADTLTVLDSDGADLDNVSLESSGLGPAVLVLPRGGRTLGGLTAESGGAIIGDYDNEGTMSLTSGILDVFGHLTELNGSMTGTNGTAFFHPASALSARGVANVGIVMQGSLDLGPASAGLAVYSISCSHSASSRFKLASRASGASDSLVAQQSCVVDGTLDLHAGPGPLPAPGDTLTIIRASNIIGTFSTVLWEGQPAAGQMQVIYDPHDVKVVVLGAVGVAPLALPTVLRFSAAGSRQQPAFALDLPLAAHLEACLYDVTGRVVARLADGALAAGRHLLTTDWADVPSGIYYARAIVAEDENTRVLTAKAVRTR